MKKIAIFFLCAVLALFVLAGCSGEKEVIIEDTANDAYSDMNNDVWENALTDDYVTEGTAAEDDTPDSVQELIAYLNRQKDKGILVSTVTYPHTLTQEDFDLLCTSLAVMHVSYTSSGDEFTFTLTQYPGNRIAEAHFSGNTSMLNDDEKQVLQIAEDMVSRAKGMTSDPFELELILHDMLLDKATYYKGSTDIPDVNNPPRHLTAVGSLLDGRANCQGFSDGFYTLATIAGFNVDRMSGFTEGEPHMFNTIFLDGEWYVVDSTAHNNDASNGDVEYLYPHFNAGLDMCGSLSWYPEYEHKPIAATSNGNYYYNVFNNAPKHNYQKIHTNLYDLAKYAVDEYQYNGRGDINLMLKGYKASDAEIHDAFRQAGTNVEFSFGYTYWYTVRGENTYISVRFSR